jgi:flagellar biosynthetic protein FlhB
MSEDQDDSQKTEDPSQRKLEQAKEKGQTVSSKELSHFFILLGGALSLMIVLPDLGVQLTDFMTPFLGRVHDMDLSAEGLRSMFLGIVLRVGMVMGLFAVLMMLAGFLGSFLQHGFLFSTQSITPSLDRISVFKGFKRIFSMKSVVELAKNLAKLVIIGAIVSSLVIPLFGEEITLLPTLSLGDQMVYLRHYALRILGGAMGAMLVIAGADYAFQFFQFRKEMRMTKQEVKEEYRQTEGDPKVKSKLKQIRRERARRRMMAKVKDATAIITNPTHYAIAIVYDKESAAAPIVVAKGVDAVAMKIREEAKKYDIPLVENPPLARALYQVDLDEEIPFEHYEAVAKVVSYVFGLKKKKS